MSTCPEVNGKNFLYIHSSLANLSSLFMDKVLSICAFPVGLLVCFGPVLIVWLRAELKNPPPDNKDSKSLD